VQERIFALSHHRTIAEMWKKSIYSSVSLGSERTTYLWQQELFPLLLFCFPSCDILL
jgi:hypothetical protein